MKQQVTAEMFVEGFRRMDRAGGWSNLALRELHSRLEELEDDIGEEIEFDVIALNGEYANYDADELEAEIESYDEDWRDRLNDPEDPTPEELARIYLEISDRDAWVVNDMKFVGEGNDRRLVDTTTFVVRIV